MNYITSHKVLLWHCDNSLWPTYIILYNNATLQLHGNVLQKLMPYLIWE